MFFFLSFFLRIKLIYRQISNNKKFLAELTGMIFHRREVKEAFSTFTVGDFSILNVIIESYGKLNSNGNIHNNSQWTSASVSAVAKTRLPYYSSRFSFKR